MSETLRWWLALELVAIAQLPLCLAFFGRLPDRGYALCKPFGIILLGFTFWFLNSMHVLPNNPGGILAALSLLVLISAPMGYQYRDELIAWARAHLLYIAGVELLFFVVFAGAVWMRALVGAISFTEQPMDLMYLNAVHAADYFPPRDPWLSGYDVAYYYFGYLLIAMLGALAGVPMAAAYNIGFGMIAALAFTGAFGIVYNLVSMRETALRADAPLSAEQRPMRRRKRGDAPAVVPSIRLAMFNWRPAMFGIAAGLVLVVMGNLVFVLMFASAYGYGGEGFYSWFHIQALAANMPRTDWYPSANFGFFNSSRVFPMNASDWVITEFPMFSFILGDLHPHVMALPFVVLAAGVALTLYRSPEPLDITYWLQRPLALLASAIVLGGLTFINTWDVATMSFVFVAAAFVSNYGRTRRITVDLFVQVISWAAPLIILSVLLYSPFLVSIAGNSQADGVYAVVTAPGITYPGTSPVNFLLYWAPLLMIVLPFIAARLIAERKRLTPNAVALAAALPAAVIAGWVLLYAFQRATGSAKLDGAGSFVTQVADRGSGWLTAIFVASALASALLATWAERAAEGERREREGVIFALLLASTALLLVLGTEFYYIGDIFNSRMNTVFKLYYQAWTLMAVAAGFALYCLAGRWSFSFGRSVAYRAAWGVAVAIVLAGAALYPLGASANRTGGRLFDGPRNVDSLAHYSQAEQNGIAFLRDRAKGQGDVIAEAVGNDYDASVSRISAATGMPTILGWEGHENQWRNKICKPCAGRRNDVNELYQTTDPARFRQILDKYRVTYIYVGDFERRQYAGPGLDKFKAMPVAFQEGTVTIYRATGGTGEVESAP